MNQLEIYKDDIIYMHFNVSFKQPHIVMVFFYLMIAKVSGSPLCTKCKNKDFSSRNDSVARREKVVKK